MLISFAGAVTEILDSLDDIEVLQESGRLSRAEILAAVDDKRLRALLEVRPPVAQQCKFSFVV